MALQPRRLFIDVQNRTFIANPISTLPSADPAWVEEDVESLEIYAVRPINDPANPYAFVDLSSATVKFAVGTTTPAALQTSFTSVSTAVTASITELQTGGSFGGLVDEIQRVTWTGATPVTGTYAIKFPERTFSASVAGKFITANNHGLYNGQSVRFSNPEGSLGFATTRSYTVINAAQDSFQLAEIGTAVAAGNDAASATVDVTTAEIVTPSISYNATIAQVQQAVVDAGFVLNGIPQVIVSGENPKQITLYYAGRNGQGAYPNVVIVNSSLAGAPGVQANVSYNTTEIAALVAAGTTAVTMEVEISEGANRQTFRQSATLSGDLITSTSPVPAPGNTSTSFNMQSQDGTVFVVSVTNDGELMIASVP